MRNNVLTSQTPQQQRTLPASMTWVLAMLDDLSLDMTRTFPFDSLRCFANLGLEDTLV